MNEALAFVASINRQDVESLLRLMTSDHIFIDTAGVRTEGRDAMRGAWEGYFKFFPDYRIEVGEMVERGDRVNFEGVSAGSLSPHGWEALGSGSYQGPALWSARVIGGLVAEWRVYNDTPEQRAELGL